jgi:hypothetical protein
MAAEEMFAQTTLMIVALNQKAWISDGTSHRPVKRDTMPTHCILTAMVEI